jgi:hypothetical protein
MLQEMLLLGARKCRFPSNSFINQNMETADIVFSNLCCLHVKSWDNC